MLPLMRGDGGGGAQREGAGPFPFLLVRRLGNLWRGFLEAPYRVEYFAMNLKKGPDTWTIRARKLGYPARSVFKLEEIQNKWHPMQRGRNIMDIGAAPGSWTLYALRTMGRNTIVSAMDIKPLVVSCPPDSNLRFFQGDIFTDKAASFMSDGRPYGCILSDAAPSTSGQRSIDARKSFELVSRIITLSIEYLEPNGNLVIKLFQGGDEKEIRDRLGRNFLTVKAFRPKAVRKGSVEMYLIGMKKIMQASKDAATP